MHASAKCGFRFRSLSEVSRWGFGPSLVSVAVILLYWRGCGVRKN